MVRQIIQMWADLIETLDQPVNGVGGGLDLAKIDKGVFGIALGAGIILGQGFRFRRGNPGLYALDLIRDAFRMTTAQVGGYLGLDILQDSDIDH
ncbi:MAG: hypothetical protein O7A03_05980, partial [Alphaproteobacteria bacterium]|nr:hypothetical protein [Alphaproteobacteria bacterium]